MGKIFPAGPFRIPDRRAGQGGSDETIGLMQKREKLEFVGRADSQVVTNVVCNRFHPDPLGIVLWRYKSEFVGPSEHVIPNQCALLSWESPSNSRQPIVIQIVLFGPFLGIYPREVVRLTGGLPHQESGLVRNDREFDKFHFVYLLNKSDMHIAKHNDCRF